MCMLIRILFLIVLAAGLILWLIYDMKSSAEQDSDTIYCVVEDVIDADIVYAVEYSNDGDSWYRMCIYTSKGAAVCDAKKLSHKGNIVTIIDRYGQCLNDSSLI